MKRDVIRFRLHPSRLAKFTICPPAAGWVLAKADEPLMPIKTEFQSFLRDFFFSLPFGLAFVSGRIRGARGSGLPVPALCTVQQSALRPDLFQIMLELVSLNELQLYISSTAYLRDWKRPEQSQTAALKWSERLCIHPARKCFQTSHKRNHLKCKLTRGIQFCKLNWNQ